ncbi:MAG: mechanosensitive ion channel family protein, partial [Puniceicoccales bacterium]
WLENLVILVGGFIIVTLIMRLLRMITKRADTSVPLQPIFMVIRWVCILVVLGLVLERFNLEIMTILTTTLAMVAIGFVAVWSLISHVLATFLLMVTKPFRVNDNVQFVGEEVDGRVVDLNLFFTTLRVTDEEHIQVPNNMFFQKALRVKKGKGETDLSTQFGRQEPAEDSTLD